MEILASCTNALPNSYSFLVRCRKTYILKKLILTILLDIKYLAYILHILMLIISRNFMKDESHEIINMSICMLSILCLTKWLRFIF